MNEETPRCRGCGCKLERDEPQPLFCIRCWLAPGEWRPIETAPQGRDVLLWVPPSPLLADLSDGHMEVGRARQDGRATLWQPLPEPPNYCSRN